MILDFLKNVKMKIMLVLDYSVFQDDYLSIAENSAVYCDSIWFRIKNMPVEDITLKASALRRLLPDKNLILSEMADIAVSLGYNGVHLNKSCEDISSVRKHYPLLTIGYSAHRLDELDSVSADYFTLSPIFNTVKPYKIIPLGVVSVDKPNVYAMGGISSDNVDALKGKGFCGIAGISFYKELYLLDRMIR